MAEVPGQLVDSHRLVYWPASQHCERENNTIWPPLALQPTPRTAFSNPKGRNLYIQYTVWVFMWHKRCPHKLEM